MNAIGPSATLERWLRRVRVSRKDAVYFWLAGAKADGPHQASWALRVPWLRLLARQCAPAPRISFLKTVFWRPLRFSFLKTGFLHSLRFSFFKNVFSQVSGLRFLSALKFVFGQLFVTPAMPKLCVFGAASNRKVVAEISLPKHINQKRFSKPVFRERSNFVFCAPSDFRF